MKKNRGFSLLEILIVIAIIGIVAAIAVPSFMAYYKMHRFNENAFSMESLIKEGKLIAMERSINVGLCVDASAKTFQVINMGQSQSNICQGDILRELEITDDFISLSGSGAFFDARGFSWPHIGSVCISRDSAKYLRATMSRFGAIRMERGNSGCP